MKIILNKRYGGFSISLEVFQKLGLSTCSRYDTELRYLPELIEMVENGEDISGDCAELCVVDIPNEATDYIIMEDDGLESVIYVLNGKIHII